jgi:hypothetical protein
MHTHSPRAARRHALGSTCLLALPTALALGAPAQAQTIINSSQASTLNISSYGATSIASGISITSTGAAAVTSSAVAQLANAGTVADASGAGIDLGAGGALSNSGNISGAEAVRLDAAGSVANSGSINGSRYGVLVNNGAGNVSNSGAIDAGYDGVSLNKGGTVTNSGTIFGAHIGVYTGNALGSVSNSGTISASSGDAVSLYSGGSLTNSATGALIGGYSGVYAGGSGSHITNAGLISGPDFGIYLMGASSVSNSGTIAGGIDGVMDLGTGGQLTNSGLIHGGQIGVKLAADSMVDNSGIVSGGTIGVKLGTNSTLANEASGRIAGGVTSVAAAAGDALQNAGTISGATGIAASGAISLTDTGVIDSTVTGGNAISLSGGASTIILGTGAQIDGSIAGNGTASQIELTGSGTLASNLIGFGAGSAVTVESGAVWTGSGQWQVVQLVNDGVFTPGALGTSLSLTGNFVQNAGGTLRVLVSPAGISPFAITGTATLGGTLRYVLAPGSYAPGNDNFLTASGGITGNFAQVTSTSTGLQATPKQLTVNGVAGGSTSGGTVSADPVAASSIVVSGGTLSINSAFTVAPSGASLFADSSQAMAMSAFASGTTLLGRADSSAPTGGWAQATGGLASATGAYSVRSGGFLAGIDHANGIGGRIGFAIGYDSANLRDKSTGTAGLRTIRLGLYAAQPIGRFVLSADVMGDIVSRNTTRSTGAEAATAKGNGNSISGDIQLAMPLSFGGAEIVPAFGLQVASVTTGRLDETSATQAFALNVAAASGTTIAPYLRMSVQKSFVTASNLVITPELTLGVSALLNNPGAKTRLTTQDGTNFITTPQHLAPLAGQLSAGITIAKGNWSITARYTGSAGGNWSGQSLQAGVLVRF